MEHTYNLLVNAALLVIMGFAYTQIFSFFRKQKILKQLLNGMLFGLITIAVMSCPAYVGTGFAFDTRSIIISVSGLFGGPVVVAETMCFAIIYRIIGGGISLCADIAIIISSGLIGLGYYYLRRKYSFLMHPVYIFLFGIVVTSIMLLCIFILPYDIAMLSIESIIIPVLALYPLVCFLVISRLIEKEAQIEAEHVLNDMLENLKVGVVIHAPDSKIIFGNLQAAKLLGISVNQMLGKETSDSEWSFLNDDGSVMTIDEYPASQVLKTHKPLMGYPLGIKSSTREITWVMVNAFPQFDIDEKLYQVVVTFTDITKQKQVHEIIKNKEENLRVTLDLVMGGIITTDIETKITYMNPEAEKLTGWKLAEANGQPLEKVFILIDKKTFSLSQLQIEHNNVSKFETKNKNTLISKNGNNYKIFESYSPIKNKNGEVSGLVLTFNNITEECKRINEIEKKNKSFECLQNISMILNSKDTPLEETLRKILYLLPEIFRHPELICAKITIDEIECKTNNYQKTEHVMSNAIKDFGRLEIYYLGSKLKESEMLFLQDEYEFIFIILEFIGNAIAQQRMADKLNNAQKEVEFANHTKDEFLENISYEIRSPLNGLLGFTEITENTLNKAGEIESKDKLLKYLELIKKSGKNVIDLVNSLSEFSSITSEKVVIFNKEFSPQELIAEIINKLNVKSEEKGIDLTFEDNNLPLKVTGPEKQLKLIMLNLIENAIKFTEKGSITVKANYKDANLVVNIKDTGIGIPDEMKVKILATSKSRQDKHIHAGTGLNLEIASKTLESLGVKLKVESKENEGTNVEFNFPVTVKIEDIDAKKNMKKHGKMRKEANILVIEDDEITAMYIDKILSSFGANYKAANSFADMEKICNEGFIPSIALIDISLPDQNGFECIKWLKHKFPDNNIRCVAQTAHASEQDKESYKEAGFDNYLSKPYSQNDLVQIINMLI